MSANIKVIGFTVRASAVLAVLTYLISLNISYGWFEVKWMSNNFLLTIIGGAFASMLVVLACEIQKYFENKTTAENRAFYHVSNLFGQFLILKKEINKAINNINDPMTTGMFDQVERNATAHLDWINQIDYTSFSKRSKVAEVLRAFQNRTSFELKNVLTNFRNLDTAIVTDQLMDAYAGKLNSRITSCSDNTGKALRIQLRDIDIALGKIDVFMVELERGSKGRLNWEKNKTIMFDVWKNTQEYGFEAFINQEV